MSRAGRPAVRAVFRIGPWVPGFVLPMAVGLVGSAAAVLVLQDVLVAVGVALAVVAALRVRSVAPWLLVATLVLGQLLHDPARLDAELPALVLALHLLVVLTLGARVVPVRARVQVAALGPAARAVGLVQLPAQMLAAVLLASAGRLQVLPVASIVGGVLLVLLAGLLVVPRRTEREE
jgi:hypothetical protein